MARLQYQAKQIDRQELINQQRHILTERRAISQRKQRGYAYPEQYETEEAASSAVLAGYSLEDQRAKEALAVVEDVLPTQQRLVENDHPDNQEVPDYDLRNYVLRQVLAELLARQAEALAKLGKPTEAAQAIRQAIEVIEPFTKPEPCYLYDLAHHLTLASTLLESAGVPDAADRAMKALEEFIASGFDNPYKLRHDVRLDPLRGRADFEALVRDLEAKVDGEADQ